jgi:hypothetical protein
MVLLEVAGLRQSVVGRAGYRYSVIENTWLIGNGFYIP